MSEKNFHLGDDDNYYLLFRYAGTFMDNFMT